MFSPILTSEQMSTISGSMSIAAWIIVYSPQIWENYQLKSGEGLSVAFVVLWLLGDLTGLFGAVLENLIPTTIILASYYTICDLVLLFQVYYYRRFEKPLPPPPTSSSSQPNQANESTALLSSPRSINNHPLPSPPQPKPLLVGWLEYPLLVSFVLAAGAGGWYISERGRNGDIEIPEKPGKGVEVGLDWSGQTLGWLSAVLYLGSRIPQIIHNTKTRCAGLSLALFFFSITGNVTYAMSILLISTEKRYLIANLSWLVGSLATVFLDLWVLGQFALFSWQDRQRAREASKIFMNEEDQIDREDV